MRVVKVAHPLRFFSSQGPRELKIFCGTWNVNGKPPSVPLEEWLLPTYGPEVVDVYVLGLQVRSSAAPSKQRLGHRNSPSL
jgi:hypothetical protein